MKAGAVVLAAGASTRLGQPKQLVTLGGERLLERAVRVARQAECDPVVVVLGASAEKILAECNLALASVVLNPHWSEGLASSIRRGVETIAGCCDAAILMTCDQPAVTAAHLRRLIEGSREAPVASSYAGRRGVPACFQAAQFAELVRLSGEEGARRLLHLAPVIELPGGELDIDTPLTLEAARALYS